MQNSISTQDEWQSIMLGALADYINGYAFKPKDWQTSGLPIVRIAQMTDPSEGFDYYPHSLPEKYRIDTGDLLFSWSATLTALIWQRGPAYLNQHIYKVVPHNGTDIRFLHHLLNHLIEKLFGHTHGTTMRHIKRSDLIPFLVSVPKKPEQSRVAAVLDTIDEAISKTTAVTTKLRQVCAGLLHDLLTRGLDENGQLRDPAVHPEQFHESPVGRIPLAWEIGSLVGRISLPEGQVDPKALPYRECPLIAPDHIESETGRLIARKTAAEQGAISGKYVFGPGDVVYSKIRPYLRKAVLATEAGLCSADMYPMRPNHGVNPRFLLAVVLGETFSRFASALSMRSGFPKLNREELAEFVMGWPRSDEQDRIAGILLAFDEEQTALGRELWKLQNLKSGMISELLTGRVRVPEDLELPK